MRPSVRTCNVNIHESEGKGSEFIGRLQTCVGPHLKIHALVAACVSVRCPRRPGVCQGHLRPRSAGVPQQEERLAQRCLLREESRHQVTTRRLPKQTKKPMPISQSVSAFGCSLAALTITIGLAGSPWRPCCRGPWLTVPKQRSCG